MRQRLHLSSNEDSRTDRLSSLGGLRRSFVTRPAPPAKNGANPQAVPREARLLGAREALLGRAPRGVLAALLVAALTARAAAQTGRVGGTVKDESGQPVKGATIT